jgi:hypothetical protein
MLWLINNDSSSVNSADCVGLDLNCAKCSCVLVDGLVGCRGGLC